MKVKITRSTVAGGKSAPVGRVVEVTNREGSFLIAIGKAVKHIEQPKASKKKASKKTSSKGE